MAARRSVRAIAALLMLACGIPAAHARQAAPDTTIVKNLFEVRKAFVLAAGSPRTFALQDSFIVAPSLQVWLNGRRLQRPRDYVLHVPDAAVLLRIQAQDGDTLRVAYTRLPLPLQKTYFRRRQISDSAATAAGRLDTVRQRIRLPQRLQREYSAELNKNGSLVRGVSVGTNQGLKVDSALRLQLAGKIAGDMEIVAALTDQNTPIQPEGNTRTLQEIDNVFIQLKSQQIDATFGDFQIGLSGTEFARYRRKLQGAQATLRQGPAQVTLFGAVSRGKFKSMLFKGIEGKQGPYQLSGDRGQIDIIVLAGTERVWIDGEPMVRGENHDYVIEYGNGQMTFTRHRLVTGDSRITVDFQYSDEKFQRNLFGAQASLGAENSKLRLNATFLREGDDRDNPLGFPLTDELRAALAGAGDSLAQVDGAIFVGEGKGSYLEQDSIFVFVGAGAGDYRVRFSDVGSGRGRYSYAGFGRYDYVGPDRGRYEPIVLLPKAQRNDLADIRMQYAPSRSLQMTTELALSNFDENLYSDQNDDNNSGAAYLFNLSYAPEQFRLFGRSLGRGELRLRRRQRAERYREIDRDNVVEFGRKWDLAEQQPAGETISEAELRFAPAPSIQFYGVAGRFEQSRQRLRSSRWEAGTRWQRPDLVDLDYRIERISRQVAGAAARNNWLRQKGMISRRIGMFRPAFELENEIKKEAAGDSVNSGFRFLDYAASLGLLRGQEFSARARFGVRTDDDRLRAQFRRVSTARTGQIELALHDWHHLSVDASVIHRERQFADSLRPDTRTDLAELKLGYANWQRAFIADMRYQITNTQANQLERVFLPVREGDGNYRFDAALGEFVQDDFGDHLLRLVPTETFLPVVELRSRLHLQLRPARYYRRRRSLGRWQRVLAALSGESLLRIEEKSRNPQVEKIYLFDIAHFQDSTFSLLGNIAFTQDIYLFENKRNFSLRYRLSTRKSLNNQFLDGAQRRRQVQHEIRVNVRLARKLASRLELIRMRQDREFLRPGRLDRLIRGVRAEGDLSWRPRPRLELAVKAVLGRDRDVSQDPATVVNRFSLKPRTVYSFAGKGQLTGELEYTTVGAAPAGRVIPFEVAQGHREGKTWRWNLSFIYRVSRNLNATLNYQGRKEPFRDRTLHIAKAEMRAFF